jgi:type VI secretion system secreted protein Hcp
MALNMYMSFFDDIPGESIDEKHPGEIEVLSYTWGASNAAVTSGGGGRAGKVQVSAFHFTARSSRASPLLFKACASGKHFKKVVLSLARTVGDQAQDFIVWTLHNVLISAYQINAEQAGPLPVDEVELSFEKVEVEYQLFDASGSPGEVVKAGWDLKLNKPV